ncbi:hypothetical protein CsSME_00013662 [Camellia sinensis var. sinensis]
MNGRTFVLILFFWAVLTIPMLVRLSASAKPTLNFKGEETKGTKAGLQLSRKALVVTAPPQAPQILPVAPAPAPAPIIQPQFGTKRLMKQ